MHNKWVLIALAGAAALIVACLVFGAGVLVGRRGDRLPNPRVFRFGLALISGGHGAVGTITTIEGNDLTLQLRDGTDKVIIVDSKTRIDRNRRPVTLSNLKPGDSVLVIGSPDAQGNINAKFVRSLEAGFSGSP